MKPEDLLKFTLFQRAYILTYNKALDSAREIYILMKLGKMTLTEIHTLAKLERRFLAKAFLEDYEKEQKAYKGRHRALNVECEQLEEC